VFKQVLFSYNSITITLLVTECRAWQVWVSCSYK